MGKAVRGFDFLGYFLRPDKLDVSGETVHRFSECIARLYEQGASCQRIGHNTL